MKRNTWHDISKCTAQYASTDEYTNISKDFALQQHLVFGEEKCEKRRFISGMLVVKGPFEYWHNTKKSLGQVQKERNKLSLPPTRF